MCMCCVFCALCSYGDVGCGMRDVWDVWWGKGGRGRGLAYCDRWFGGEIDAKGILCSFENLTWRGVRQGHCHCCSSPRVILVFSILIHPP